MERRKLQGDLIATFQYLKRGYKKEGNGFFSRICGDKTKGNAFKLKEGRFRLDIRKKVVMIRIMKHRKRLPREVLDAPFLETFKVRLDGALNT